MTTEDAKTYLSKREIPRLFESLMTGLMFHRPSDHYQYLIECLEKAKNNGQVTWNMFVDYKRTKTPLPPITPENGRRPGSRGRRSATPKEEPKPLDSNRGTPLPPIGATESESLTQETSVTTVSTVQPASAPVAGIPDVPFVLVMGGPGSGKLTQIQKLMARADGWVHISVGDLIRREVTEKGSSEDRWKMAGDLMSRGEMAPEEDVIELFLDEIQRNKSAKGFIIEGYPRDMNQLQDYEKNVGRVDLCMLIDCEERSLSTRLLKLGATTKRLDLSIEAVQKRLLFFKDKTLPVIKYFDDQGKVSVFEGEQEEDSLGESMITVFENVIFGKEKPVDVKVPAPPSEPKPERRRSAKTRSPEPKESASDLDIPDLPAIPADMMPAEVNVKDEGRKPDMPECPIIFLAGGPGSGKGTQCKKIVERYEGVAHVSMGDILRTEITTRGSADEKWGMISALLTEGDMAPEDVTIELLTSSIKKHSDARAIIIEGYPRDLRQLEEFNKHVGGLGLVILLDCEEYYLQERLINRGAESGRPDDNLGAIGKRISFFKENTLPILKHFDDEEKLAVVMGDRDDAEIFYDISQILDFALYGRKPDLQALPPQADESGQEEEVKASADEQEETTPPGQKEVVEEEMVAQTTTVTGGDDGNPQYSEQLNAAAAEQEENTQKEGEQNETAEQEADAQKEDDVQKPDEQAEDGQKVDEQTVDDAQKAEEQTEEAQKEDDAQKAGEQAEDGQKVDEQTADDAQKAEEQTEDSQKADGYKQENQQTSEEDKEGQGQTETEQTEAAGQEVVAEDTKAEQEQDEKKDS